MEQNVNNDVRKYPAIVLQLNKIKTLSCKYQYKKQNYTKIIEITNSDTINTNNNNYINLIIKLYFDSFKPQTRQMCW